jgi:hypothetical protein
MRAHIYWEKLTIVTDQASIPPGYTVWYQDEVGRIVASEQGRNREQTIEALYKNLKHQGYSRSSFPKPEPFRINNP